MSEVLKREARICQPILDLPGSRIRVVTRASADIPDMIKLWFGEGDEPTPEFIREGAKAALDRGETFYAANRAIPPLMKTIHDRSEEHTSELQPRMRNSDA